MLTCKEVATKVSSETEHLSILIRLELKAHLFMCRHCSRYVKQLEKLKKAVLKNSADVESELKTEAKKIEVEVILKESRRD